MEMVVEEQNQSNIAAKDMKFEETVEMLEDDRISSLPDCLLLEILTRLPSTKDAITTSTLSKRWEHLWTLVHILIFKHYEAYDSSNPSRRNPNSMPDFVSFVDKTLTQCRQLNLKKFVVGTNYDTRFESQVNNWIHYAIRCDVEELDLTFSTMGYGVRFSLDQKFFTGSCFVDLKLSGCIFNPTGAISWKNLRRLCISGGIIDENLIENIQSGSPHLEILALNHCSGYRRLNITSKSVKYLMFSSYMAPNDQLDTNVIEINAPNIVYLTIQGTLILWILLLGNVSSLEVADLDYNHYTNFGHWDPTHEEMKEVMLKRFILNLHHVQELNIGESCHRVLRRLVAKGFNITPNMKFPGVPYDYYDSDSLESDDCDSVESGDSDSVEGSDCDSDESVDRDSVESEDF